MPKSKVEQCEQWALEQFEHETCCNYENWIVCSVFKTQKKIQLFTFDLFFLSAAS